MLRKIALEQARAYNLDELPCSLIVRQLQNLSEHEVDTYVLHKERLNHFNPEELALVATRSPKAIVKKEILQRYQAPTALKTKGHSHVWTVSALHALISAFPNDVEISIFVNSKINEAPDNWFREADTETLITFLRAIHDKARVLKELGTRRYAMTSIQLQSILSART